MLSLDVKKLLLRAIPPNISVDGYSFPICRTLGPTPLNTLTLPTVNLKVIGEGTPYYRSFDDNHTMNNSINTYKNTYVCTLRYTIASTDTVIPTTQSIQYVTGTNIYPLDGVPCLDITDIATYTKNTDYQLNVTRDAIEWIGNTPANDTTFIVEYNWVDSGMYITHQLTEYLMKDIHGRIFDMLKPYGIDMIDSKGVVDISDIYANDALSAYSFDIVITYPFTWTTSVSSEDAVVAESIALTLFVNEINAGVIR